MQLQARSPDSGPAEAQRLCPRSAGRISQGRDRIASAARLSIVHGSPFRPEGAPVQIDTRRHLRLAGPAAMVRIEAIKELAMGIRTMMTARCIKPNRHRAE